MSALDILETLQSRFQQNPLRHPNLSWDAVQRRLRKHPEALVVLQRMENTGGEPDVVETDAYDELVFFDCSKESPPGRRSLCYDDAALQSRRKNPPVGSALGLARDMGVELLPEEMYRKLQSLGEYDLKTSSWINTPAEVRARGGALFCERRYGVVFTFHNGADSYYKVRGWRGMLRV